MHVLTSLRRPIITEKSTILQEQNKYVFEVALRSNKVQVKEAVERAFGVKVKSVNIMKIKGEHKYIGGTRRITKLPDVKKAVVTLRQGEAIQIFEGA